MGSAPKNRGSLSLPSAARSGDPQSHGPPQLAPRAGLPTGQEPEKKKRPSPMVNNVTPYSECSNAAQSMERVRR